MSNSSMTMLCAVDGLITDKSGIETEGKCQELMMDCLKMHGPISGGMPCKLSVQFIVNPAIKVGVRRGSRGEARRARAPPSSAKKKKKEGRKGKERKEKEKGKEKERHKETKMS